MKIQLAKRRKEDEEDDYEVGSGSDRISGMPECLLLHILCFLSKKKAVQTSLLSKSWRHLGPNLPVIELCGNCGYNHNHVRRISDDCENCFLGDKEEFLSVLENTFQRYHDQNLFLQELDLKMFDVDSRSNSILQKWIPEFVNPDKPAVTTLRLWFGRGPYFDLPSVVFRAESLRELHLHGCRLSGINGAGDWLLKNLQTLSLSRVDFTDEALEKIIAACPLLERIVLFHHQVSKTMCIGKKNPCLKHIELSGIYAETNGTLFKIDTPTVQSISIDRCSNWYPKRSDCFPRLKSLSLSLVNLSTELFDNFSSRFPRLEELKLEECSGFEEINLSSHSIKRLIVTQSKSWSMKKVVVEVPNIRYFEFSCMFLQTALSLTTTSGEWKSHLNLADCSLDAYKSVLPIILRLIEIVKTLSQSQTSLTLSDHFYFKINQIEWDFNKHPIALEHLDLSISKLHPDSVRHFLNALFRIFRPRYTNAVGRSQKAEEIVTECLWKSLIHEKEKTKYGWEQYLEEVSIEAYDEKAQVWYHVQWTFLLEWSKDQKVRFRLKWRD